MKTKITLLFIISMLLTSFNSKAQLGFEFQESAHYTYNVCYDLSTPWGYCEYQTVSLFTVPMGIMGISDRVITNWPSNIQLYDIDTIGMGSGPTDISGYYIYFDSTKNQIKAFHENYFWGNYPDMENNFSNYDSLTRVLFDFSQNVGDTLNSDLYSYSNQAPFIITQVDTVLFLANYRKKITFKPVNSSTHYSIYEGLGALVGRYSNEPYHSNIQDYVCIRLDDVLTVGLESGCQLSIEEKGAIELNLHPNPTQNEFSFHLSEPYNSQHINYSILDISGKKVLEGIRLSNVEIDVSSLPNGYYVVQVQIGEQFVSKSLIVNR
jgi:hypothetical protein